MSKECLIYMANPKNLPQGFMLSSPQILNLTMYRDLSSIKTSFLFRQKCSCFILEENRVDICLKELHLNIGTSYLVNLITCWLCLCFLDVQIFSRVQELKHLKQSNFLNWQPSMGFIHCSFYIIIISYLQIDDLIINLIIIVKLNVNNNFNTMNHWLFSFEI